MPSRIQPFTLLFAVISAVYAINLLFDIPWPRIEFSHFSSVGIILLGGVIALIGIAIMSNALKK